MFIEKYIHVGKMRNLMNRQMHADVYNKNASWSILHENESWAFGVNIISAAKIRL